MISIGIGFGIGLKNTMIDGVEPPSPEDEMYLLLESGDDILLENTESILLEKQEE